jgi:hypothetical protein
MSRYQIRCINKANRTNPHERIVNVGGSWGKISSGEAIRRLKSRTDSFFVVDAAGREVDVIVKQSASGNDYLTTEPDGTTQNNLLSLPECP